MSDYIERKKLRDQLAAHAPVDFMAAHQTYGRELNLNSDQERAAFFAVWALLRYEYADAMLHERSAVKPQPVLAFYKDVRGVLEKMLADDRAFGPLGGMEALDNYRCMTNMVLQMIQAAIREVER